MKSLDQLLEQLDADEAESKKAAIDQMILGVRTTCIVPGDMSDNDIKALFEPFLTDEYLDQFEDENDLFNDILPKILTVLTSNGIKIKFN
jgi:hypothetical protein